MRRIVLPAFLGPRLRRANACGSGTTAVSMGDFNDIGVYGGIQW
jgi:hypothetical protein